MNDFFKQIRTNLPILVDGLRSSDIEDLPNHALLYFIMGNPGFEMLCKEFPEKQNVFSTKNIRESVHFRAYSIVWNLQFNENQNECISTILTKENIQNILDTSELESFKSRLRVLQKELKLKETYRTDRSTKPIADLDDADLVCILIKHSLPELQPEMYEVEIGQCFRSIIHSDSPWGYPGLVWTNFQDGPASVAAQVTSVAAIEEVVTDHQEIHSISTPPTAAVPKKECIELTVSPYQLSITTVAEETTAISSNVTNNPESVVVLEEISDPQRTLISTQSTEAATNPAILDDEPTNSLIPSSDQPGSILAFSAAATTAISSDVTNNRDLSSSKVDACRLVEERRLAELREKSITNRNIDKLDEPLSESGPTGSRVQALIARFSVG